MQKLAKGGSGVIYRAEVVDFNISEFSQKYNSDHNNEIKPGHRIVIKFIIKSQFKQKEMEILEAINFHKLSK
jgi:hypothetical protein